MKKDNLPVIFTEPFKKVEAEIVPVFFGLRFTKPVNAEARFTPFGVPHFTMRMKRNPLTGEIEVVNKRKRAKAKP